MSLRRARRRRKDYFSHVSVPRRFRLNARIDGQPRPLSGGYCCSFEERVTRGAKMRDVNACRLHCVVSRRTCERACVRVYARARRIYCTRREYTDTSTKGERAVPRGQVATATDATRRTHPSPSTRYQLIADAPSARERLVLRTQIDARFYAPEWHLTLYVEIVRSRIQFRARQWQLEYSLSLFNIDDRYRKITTTISAKTLRNRIVWKKKEKWTFHQSYRLTALIKWQIVIIGIQLIVA